MVRADAYADYLNSLYVAWTDYKFAKANRVS